MRDAVATGGRLSGRSVPRQPRVVASLNSPLSEWQRSVVLLARSKLERHEDYELGYSDREQVATG